MNGEIYGREFDKLPFGRYKALSRIDTKFVSEADHANFVPIGMTALYGFPYNLYSVERLPPLVGTSTQWRYKVHAPIRLQNNGTPLSPEVPFHIWPSFKWSPVIPAEARIEPPKNLSIAPNSNNPTTYRALRIDIWGPDINNEMDKFSNRFLEWLRYLSSQPWINSYEFHSDSPRKYEFYIDEEGRTIEMPKAVVTHTTSTSSPINMAAWATAFKKAVAKEEVERYWSVFMDAQTSFARNSLWEAALFLVLSIEIAKNTNFQRFCQFKIKNGLVCFEGAFKKGSSLEDLSDNLERKIGRNLKREKEGLWDSFDQMYTARHHIAHGKPAVYKKDGEIRAIDDSSVTEWIKATLQIIAWIEKLKPS